MLIDDVTAALPALRAQAEALMVDACEITSDPQGSFNETTKTWSDPADSEVYDGPCQVRMPTAVEVEVEFAGSDVTTQKLIVKIPVSATGVEVGHVVTITDVHPRGDSDLVGRVFRVVGLHWQTFSTSRRLACEAVTSG